MHLKRVSKVLDKVLEKYSFCRNSEEAAQIYFLG